MGKLGVPINALRHFETLLACGPEALALRVATAGDHALGQLTTLGAARAFPLRLQRVADPIAPRVSP